MSQNRILTMNIEKNLENLLEVELIEFGQFEVKVKMSLTFFHLIIWIHYSDSFTKMEQKFNFGHNFNVYVICKVFTNLFFTNFIPYYFSKPLLTFS